MTEGFFSAVPPLPPVACQVFATDTAWAPGKLHPMVPCTAAIVGDALVLQRYEGQTPLKIEINSVVCHSQMAPDNVVPVSSLYVQAQGFIHGSSEFGLGICSEFRLVPDADAEKIVPQLWCTLTHVLSSLPPTDEPVAVLEEGDENMGGKRRRSWHSDECNA